MKTVVSLIGFGLAGLIVATTPTPPAQRRPAIDPPIIVVPAERGAAAEPEADDSDESSDPDSDEPAERPRPRPAHPKSVRKAPRVQPVAPAPDPPSAPQPEPEPRADQPLIPPQTIAGVMLAVISALSLWASRKQGIEELKIKVGAEDLKADNTKLRARVDELESQVAANTTRHGGQSGKMDGIVETLRRRGVFGAPAVIGAIPQMLIVEDDKINARFLARLMTRRGFQTEIAATLEEARELLTSDHFCFMLLDLNIGSDDGAELLRYVRDEHIPIRSVVITGIDDEARLATVRALNPYAVYIKPILDPDELLKRVDPALCGE